MKQRLVKAGGPQVPQHIQDELVRIAGRNRFGEPKLQLVHGSTATMWMAGEFHLKYARRRRVQVGWSGLVNGQMRDFPITTPKNLLPLIVQGKWDSVEVPFPGWVLESWIGPEKLAPQWEMRRWQQVPGSDPIDMLGELPERGAYQHLWSCVDGEGRPLDVMDRRILQVVGECVRLIEERGLGEETLSEEKALEQQRVREDLEAKEESAVEAEFDGTVEDIEDVYRRISEGLQPEYSLPRVSGEFVSPSKEREEL